MMVNDGVGSCELVVGSATEEMSQAGSRRLLMLHRPGLSRAYPEPIQSLSRAYPERRVYLPTSSCGGCPWFSEQVKRHYGLQAHA